MLREISYYKEITRDECRNLQTNGFLSVANTQILGIQPNSTTSGPVIFAGDNDHSGNCHGGSYSDPYGSFKNVYVAGWVEIKLQNSYQPVQIDADHIRLNSGVACVISDAYCIDEDGGHVFWDLMPEDACGINIRDCMREIWIEYTSQMRDVRYIL